MTEKKASVTFDNGEALLLPIDVIFKFQLRKGDELNEETFQSLLIESNKVRIMEASLRYLALRMHSASELYTKLLKKKYDKELIKSVLTQLQENSLLDDERFALQFTLECYFHRKYGKTKLIAMLKQRGIKPPIIDKALASLGTPEEGEETPVQFVARKKIRQLKARQLPNSEIFKKTAAYLMQRGFNFGEIKSAINSILSDQPDESEEYPDF